MLDDQRGRYKSQEDKTDAISSYKGRDQSGVSHKKKSQLRVRVEVRSTEDTSCSASDETR